MPIELKGPKRFIRKTGEIKDLKYTDIENASIQIKDKKYHLLQNDIKFSYNKKDNDIFVYHMYRYLDNGEEQFGRWYFWFKKLPIKENQFVHKIKEYEREIYVKLVQPSKDMEKHFIDMAVDYKMAKEPQYQVAFDENFNFSKYVEKLIKDSKEEHLKPGYVPSTTFWLIDNHGKILGVSRLRHYLVPHLEKEGGHIGYDVPPTERMKGYGTILLKHTLEKAKEMGIEQVLITCDTDNVGSAKIIVNNGGIFENEIISSESGKQVSRYWVK